VLLALTNASYPPGIDILLPGQPIAQAVIRATTVVAVAGFFTLPFVFPDGRFVPRWTVLWGAYAAVGVFGFAFVPALSPEGQPWLVLEAVTTGLLVLSIVGSVAYRYRRVSTPEQRRQTKWVMLGLMIGVPLFLLGDALMRNIDGSPVGVACLLGFLVVMPLSSILPTAALGVAILNHRLFDVDLIIGRTLVSLAMTALVVGGYVGLVLGVGGVVGGDSVLLSLVATGLVAVAFHPLRERVQRGVNRLLYGDRDDPYAVLARLGRRLEGAPVPDEILPGIVRTLSEALRLPYAAIVLGGGERPMLAAAAGTPAGNGNLLRLPLVYQSEPVGELVVGARAGRDLRPGGPPAAGRPGAADRRRRPRRSPDRRPPALARAAGRGAGGRAPPAATRPARRARCPARRTGDPGRGLAGHDRARSGRRRGAGGRAAGGAEGGGGGHPPPRPRLAAAGAR
jgi:uncharacterized membrane protein YgcG